MEQARGAWHRLRQHHRLSFAQQRHSFARCLLGGEYALARSHGHPADCFPPLCPDFAAELVPDAQERPEIEDKMREFLARGMKLGWLLDPRLKRVETYRPGQDV